MPRVVRDVGAGVDPAWLGVRVTGDTMLGCGTCDRCTTGRRHVCRDLVEVGIGLVREAKRKDVLARAHKAAEDRVLGLGDLEV